MSIECVKPHPDSREAPPRSSRHEAWRVEAAGVLAIRTLDFYSVARYVYYKMDVIEVTALATLCAYQYYNALRIYHLNKKRKSKRRRWWMTSIHRNRTM